MRRKEGLSSSLEYESIDDASEWPVNFSFFQWLRGHLKNALSKKWLPCIAEANFQ
jgi:hypothetical protein